MFLGVVIFSRTLEILFYEITGHSSYDYPQLIIKLQMIVATRFEIRLKNINNISKLVFIVQFNITMLICFDKMVRAYMKAFLY